MKKINLIIAILIISITANAQGWVGNSVTNSLSPYNSSLGLTPLRIGIGTATPNETLEVQNGNFLLGGSNSIYLGGITNTNNNGVRITNNSTANGGYFDVRTTNTTQGLNFRVDDIDGGTDRMIIRADGNVGIGTIAPTEQLHTNLGVRFEGLTKDDILNRVIVQNSSGKLYWRDASTIGNNGTFWNTFGNANAINPGTGTGQNYLGTSTNNRIVFATGGLTSGVAERMTILNESGNVGVNISNPVFKLHVVDNTVWNGNTTTGCVWGENNITGAANTANNQIAKMGVFGRLNISTTGTLQTNQRSFISGVVGQINKAGTGDINTTVSSVASSMGITGSGIITDLVSLRANAPENFPPNSGYTGTITNFYGLRIENCQLVAGLDVSARITNRYGVFQAGAGERNFFAGNVGLGTTTPAQRLHVAGNIQANTTLYTSDLRYKKEIKSLENQLEVLKKLTGKSYEWKTEEFKDRNFDNKLQFGFIAQEIESVIPNIVHTDEQGFKSVNYTQLIPVLTEAIKEINTKVEKQNNAVVENESLKSDIASLKSENELIKEKFALLEKSIAALCENGCGGLKNATTSSDLDALYQSIPNPTDDIALINYFLTKEYIDARIVINTQEGKQIQAYKLESKLGAGSVKVSLGELSSGTYLYTLTVGGHVVDTKRLQIVK